MSQNPPPGGQPPHGPGWQQPHDGNNSPQSQNEAGYGWSGQPSGYPGGGQGNQPPNAQLPPTGKKNWFARHKILTALLGLIALFFAIAALGGSDDSGTEDGKDVAAAAEASNAPGSSDADEGVNDSDSQAEDESTQGASSQPVALPGIGEVVSHNTFDFTVESLECGVDQVGSEYFEEKAQGQFCVVKIAAKNTGTKAQMFIADDQKLMDAEGREYSYSTDATFAAMTENDDVSWYDEINPGNTLKGQIIYDVPKAVVPTKLHVSDGGFTDKGTDISLS